MTEHKTCAVCGCPYVGASCPNCGSHETEDEEREGSPCYKRITYADFGCLYGERRKVIETDLRTEG